MTLHPLGAAARAFFLFLIYPRLLRQKTSCVMMQEQHIRNLSHFLPSFIRAASLLSFSALVLHERWWCLRVLCCCSNDTIINKDINEREREREKAGLAQQMERARLLFAAIWWYEKKSRRRNRVDRGASKQRTREREALLAAANLFYGLTLSMTLTLGDWHFPNCLFVSNALTQELLATMICIRGCCKCETCCP